jgi:hypothetical protein
MPDAPRPALKRASVLTCVAATPPSGSFRPAYSGSTKTLYNTANLRRSLLLDLAPPSFVPSTSVVLANVERVWLDHKPFWTGRYTRPSANMEDYGRNMAAQYNDAVLLLLLDIPDKEALLVSAVQIGIDLHAMLLDGARFNWGGGHGIGRKWPILFAGLLLDDPAMLDIGLDYGPEAFQEDCQTFYVTEEDKRLFPDLFPVVGAPAWGEWHCTRRTDDQSRNYRTCCTANGWVGAVLGARLLGVQGHWNWPALFDYTDDYMAEQPAGWTRSWSSFAEDMWDRYRPQ